VRVIRRVRDYAVWAAVTACLGCLAFATSATAAVFSPVAGSPFAVSGLARMVRFSPDGRLLAVSTDSTRPRGQDASAVTLYAVSRAGALTRLAHGVSAGVADVEDVGPFLPDGRAVLIWHGERMAPFAVGRDGVGARLSAWRRIPNEVYGGGWLTRAGVLAVNGDGTIWTFQTHGDALMPAPASPFKLALVGSVTQFGVTLSPDGRWLAAGGTLYTLSRSGNDVNRLQLYPLSPGGAVGSHPTASLQLGSGDMGDMTFSPESAVLAVADWGRGRLQTYTVGAGGSLTPSPGAPLAVGEVSGLAFSPDGRMLAVAPNSGDDVLVYAMDGRGRLRRVADLRTAHVTPPYLGPEAVAFSPDGRLLVVANWSNETVSMFTVR
jgi:sugar lactone lactonase YvrE